MDFRSTGQFFGPMVFNYSVIWIQSTDPAFTKLAPFVLDSGYCDGMTPSIRSSDEGPQFMRKVSVQSQNSLECFSVSNLERTKFQQKSMSYL